jgi:hypothetical protein
METPRESQAGYPEEAPAEVEPGGDAPPEDTPPRKGARSDRKHATEGDDGKATGNRRSAG